MQRATTKVNEIVDTRVVVDDADSCWMPHTLLSQRKMLKLMNWLYFFTRSRIVFCSRKSWASSFRCRLQPQIQKLKAKIIKQTPLKMYQIDMTVNKSPVQISCELLGSMQEPREPASKTPVRLSLNRLSTVVSRHRSQKLAGPSVSH